MSSIVNGLFSGRSGLQSHGSAIAVLADNISNANTIAYKASRAEFSDLVAGSITGGGGITIGSGSQVKGTTEVFSQGTFEFTGRGLDTAIDGNGFFVLEDNGARFFSRAGNLKINESGDLLSQSGLNVLGFPSNGAGGLQPLNVNTITQGDVDTQNVSFTGNLNASAATTVIPGPGATFAQLQTAASFTNFVDVFDTLGAKHTVTVYFFKTAPNQFDVRAFVDGSSIGGSTAGTAVPMTLSPAPQLFFNPDGSLDTAAPGPVSTPTFTATPPTGAPFTGWSSGASNNPINFDFRGFTQFSSPSSINSITQDGKGGGNVVSFNIELDGTLFAQLDNGQTSRIGTIALATFSNPEGLGRNGNSLYIKTTTSGEPVIGTPNTGQYGALQSGAIELSTSDIAADFIKLISFQRGFQSSSRIITTIDDLLNEVVNLAR